MVSGVIKMSNPIKIGVILDIDGTMCESLFNNEQEQKNTKEFLKKLANVKPYPIVRSEIQPLVSRADYVRVITGRQQFMIPITTRWLTKVLKSNDYDLITKPFKDYTQYIKDKKQSISDAIDYFEQVGCSVIIYEDDEKITRWIKDQYYHVTLHKVTKGISTKV
jgi:hypothetical protein